MDGRPERSDLLEEKEAEVTEEEREAAEEDREVTEEDAAPTAFADVGRLVREATGSEVWSWRRARVRVAVSAVGSGLWWAVKGLLSEVGVPADDRDEPRAGPPTGRARPARVLTPLLDGVPAERLLADGRHRGSLDGVAPPGALAPTRGGLLWQPDRQGERSLVLPAEDVTAIVVGLPGAGILIELTDGDIAFRLTDQRGRLSVDDTCAWLG